LAGNLPTAFDGDGPYCATCIEAVFASWNSPRTVAYRAHYGLDDQAGTAAVVQAMVFGNHGANSGADVMSTSSRARRPNAAH
jgi:pyruvate, orthophosphate dikinase